MFNDVYSGAVIQDLFVENFTHSTKADVYYMFGVIARTVHEGAEIINCHVSASFDTPPSRYPGNLTREEFGGIAATNSGMIRFCSVKLGETKKNTGGIVAQNKGSVTECYADIRGVQGAGIVYHNDDAGKISNCIATGYGRSVGGIFMYSGSFANVENSISTVVCDTTPFELDAQLYSSFSGQYSYQKDCKYLYFDRYYATSPEFYENMRRIYGEDAVRVKTEQLPPESLGSSAFFDSLGYTSEHWIFEEGKCPRLANSYSDGKIYPL